MDDRSSAILVTGPLVRCLGKKMTSMTHLTKRTKSPL